MRDLRALPRVLGAVACAGIVSAASADIIPLSGAQTLHGLTTIQMNGSPVATGSFDLAAPNPMASWSPPTQNANIIAAGSYAELQSSYVSAIGPGGVSLSTITTDELEGNADVPSTASLEFSALLDLRLSIGTAGLYTISASILRAADPQSTPASIRFGPEGGAPIVSLETAGTPWPPGVDLHYPATTMMLGPGVYTLRAADGDTRSGGPHSYMHHSKLDFSISLVPAPGSAAVMALGLAAWARRRR